MKTLNVTNITDLNNLPPNAIIVTYSDHYSGNSGDDVYFTDNEGMIGDMPHYMKWSQYEDDRGIISVHAISSDKGGLRTYHSLKSICDNYVRASNDLKSWNNGEYIYII